MLVGGMLAVWILQRERALDAGDDVGARGRSTIPEVPANVMLIGVWGLCVFAQWASWSARRGDRRAHRGSALGLVAVMALALINAQAYVYAQMGLPIADETGYAGDVLRHHRHDRSPCSSSASGSPAVAAFRFLGGRTADREIVAAHALYWYVLAAVFSAVWLIVYVTK